MKKYLVLLSVLCILLTGCNSNNEISYYVVEETLNDDTHSVIVSDGEYLYDYEGDKLKNKRLPVVQTTDKAMQFKDIDGEFTLSDLGNNIYSGTLDDVSKYVSLLGEYGFEVYSMYRCPTYIDAYLTDNDLSVRIIINSNNRINIFGVDAVNSPIAPPYINEEV